MKHRNFFLILAASTALLAQADPDAVAIKQIWVNYAAFVEKGDAQGWLAQYDAEGIQLRPDAPARSKSELDAQVPGAFKARVEANDVKMVILPLEITITGPWAFSQGTYTQDFTAKATGQTVHVDGKFLTIFRKQSGGGWKIYRDCFNSNVPPK
jgi:ketosteroid isomerase-like protein